MLHFRDKTQPERDVLVTGIGMVTPLGHDRESSWQRLLDGAKAGRALAGSEIDRFEQLTELLGHVPGGAPVDHAAVASLASAACGVVERQKVFESFGHDELNNLLIVSFFEAIQHAGIEPSQLASARTGCVIGTSKASLRAMESLTQSVDERQTLDANLFLNSFLSDAPLRAVLALSGANGPATCPVAACATGLVSVIQAAQIVRSGQCDICIAGSGDASLRSSVLASFHRLGVTSKHNDPATACRPFDEDRDGFVIGEGAAVFILESRRHAATRNARSLGQIVAGGWLTDPTGVTQIDSSGKAVARVVGGLEKAMNGEGTRPEFCCLHGTATETNDLAEANGLRESGHAATPCFGIKGAIGHLLGAAGGVELATTLLALRDGILPPTANLQNADPDCALNLSNSSVRTTAHTALKLSLGFGGHIAGCVVAK